MENLESQRVMMNVMTAGRVAKTALWISGPSVMLLYTLCKRLVKHKVMKQGEFEKLSSFIKATNGDYSIMNLPIKEEHAIGFYWEKDKLSKVLDRLGIQFTILPDLNPEDGLLQVAISNKDKHIFGAWQERYLYHAMQGGEKSVAYLNRLTDKQTSIIDVPFEGKQEIIRKDFDTLNINYGILPDLCVGDGNLQLLIANEDLQKVEHWYKLYQENMIKKGEIVEDMHVLNGKQGYLDTSKITEDAYIDNSSSDIKKINALYERESGELERVVLGKNTEVRSRDYELYKSMKENPEFQEISINKESLVENSKYGTDKTMLEHGVFVSRVPGTYGENELSLIVPNDNVFLAEGEETYRVFLPKRDKPILCDSKREILPEKLRPLGAEFAKRYETVTYDIKVKQSLDMNPNAKKEIKNTIHSLRKR